jgi:hypothetical protein
MFRVSIRVATIMLWLALVCGCAALVTGCHWTDKLKGEGFPAWSDSIGAGARGNGTAAQPSGFFTDRRSEEIERNLGGGF